MTWTEALPWVGPIGTILTIVGSVWVSLRAQARQSRANAEVRAAQHAENVGRLDHLTDRVKAVEKNGERQTDILVHLAEIKSTLEGMDRRIELLENRDAGRRIAAKGA